MKNKHFLLMCVDITIKYINCINRHNMIERIRHNPRCRTIFRESLNETGICSVCYPTPITSDED